MTDIHIPAADAAFLRRTLASYQSESHQDPRDTYANIIVNELIGLLALNDARTAPAGSARGDEGTPAGASGERTWCSNCERTYRLEQPGHSCPMCSRPLTETPTLRAAMDRQPQQRR